MLRERPAVQVLINGQRAYTERQLIQIGEEQGIPWTLATARKLRESTEHRECSVGEMIRDSRIPYPAFTKAIGEGISAGRIFYSEIAIKQAIAEYRRQQAREARRERA